MMYALAVLQFIAPCGCVDHCRSPSNLACDTPLPAGNPASAYTHTAHPCCLPPCSVPKRRPMDETQETLRTSAFPSTHVKEKWAKNLYIAGVAYGRTVS